MVSANRNLENLKKEDCREATDALNLAGPGRSHLWAQTKELSLEEDDEIPALLEGPELHPATFKLLPLI